jgi:NADPH:quinone reductase
VVVDVRAVSVNRTLDLAVRAGSYVRRPPLPHVLGVDPAGVVTVCGPGVPASALGSRVFVNLFVRSDAPDAVMVREVGRVKLLGVDIPGGYAERVAVPFANIHPLPEGLSFSQAVVIGRHGPTAINLIERRAQVQVGERVLVMGASGGLGSLAVQVAVLNGARVIAAAGSPDRAQAARALGAETVVDYRAGDLEAQVMAATDGHGVDVVCDNVGDPQLWPAAFRSLAVGGRMVTAGAHAGGEVTLDLRRLYLRRLQIIGDGSEALGGLQRSFDLAAEGRLRGLVDRAYPLAEAAAAHARVAARAGTGKVLLLPRPEEG